MKQLTPAPVKTQVLSSDGLVTVNWLLYFQQLSATIDDLQKRVSKLDGK